MANALLDFLQGASNGVASNVSAPVDGLAWLLRKAGLGNVVGDTPVGGSDWMAQKGLTRQPANALVGGSGEFMGNMLGMGIPAKPIAGAVGEVNALAKYAMEHRPMTDAGGAARLHDLTPAFGEDVYGPQAMRFFGSGGAYDAAERQILKMMKSVRGKPDAPVTIYRGLPADVPTGINPGDWVTLSPQLAELYGPNVARMTVPASHVTSWADSLGEFGYHPPSK